MNERRRGKKVTLPFKKAAGMISKVSFLKRIRRYQSIQAPSCALTSLVLSLSLTLNGLPSNGGLYGEPFGGEFMIRGVLPISSLSLGAKPTLVSRPKDAKSRRSSLCYTLHIPRTETDLYAFFGRGKTFHKQQKTSSCASVGIFLSSHRFVRRRARFFLPHLSLSLVAQRAVTSLLSTQLLRLISGNESTRE